MEAIGNAASRPLISKAGLRALLDCIASLPRPQDAQRCFHGRGGVHADSAAWLLDAYPPAWLLTHHGAVDPAELAAVQAALATRCAEIAPGEAFTLVLQQRQEGGRSTQALLAGALPEPHVVQEDGAAYEVDLLRGQNHGLFLDMVEGRRWVRALTQAQPGLRVLNLFAYTGAFSVAARQGGAATVVNVDMARGALATSSRNHARNALGAGVTHLAHDVFVSWAKLRRLGPYGLVIADPPGHQPGSFVAPKDYARLLRQLPGLLAPGGQVLLCATTPKLTFDELLALVAQEAPTLRVLQRLPNPAVMQDRDAQRSLKVLVLQGP